MSGIIDLIEWRRLREAPEGELQRREHAPGMPEPDPRGVARLDRAAERLYELVSRALEATGRLEPGVETELLAIIGELTVGLVTQAARRAERLADQLAGGQ